MKNISRLHYITQQVKGFSHSQLAEFACLGGADWVQLRAKDLPYEELLEIAEETKAICKSFGAKLIINDNVHIAKKIGADGVHLGKEDMDPLAARRILGDNFIIGGSANTLEDILSKISKTCDYVGLGPFRFTSTKTNLNPVLGLEGIKRIINSPVLTQGPARDIPIIAIGGIQKSDIKTLLDCGIYGIAVSSAINLNDERSKETSSFVQCMQGITFSNAGC